MRHRRPPDAVVAVPRSGRGRWPGRGSTDAGSMTLIMAATSAGVVVVFVAVLMPLLLFGGDDAVAGCAVPADATQAPTPLGKGAAKPAKAVDSIPANYLVIYQKSGQSYGVDWAVLAALGKTESDHGRSNLPGVKSGENYAGAGGPMQFLKGTWTSNGVDGNGDGIKDRYNPEDAIPSAANYLKHLMGGGKSLEEALAQYKGDPRSKEAQRNAAAVMAVAAGYRGGDVAQAPDNTAGDTCAAQAAGKPPAGSLPLPTGSAGSALGRAIVAAAYKWIGEPYAYGGGDPVKGPTRGQCSGGSGYRNNVCLAERTIGFDCSGLVQHAVYQASGSRILLPRTAAAQSTSSKGIAIIDRSDLQVGDVIGFGSPAHHIGIYVGGGRMIHAPQTTDFVRVSSLASRKSSIWTMRRFG